MSETANWSALVSVHALSVIQQRVGEPQKILEAIQHASDSFHYYPDGSILAEGGDSVHRTWNLILGGGLVDTGIWQPMGFVGLNRFPGQPRNYGLFYTHRYQESLGESGFSVAFPSMWACRSEKYDLKNLLISVGFAKVTSKQTQRAFSQMIGQWFASVSAKGIFGDGPVKLVSGGIEYNKRLAQFRVDASESGQNTLNWLLLSVLNFGYEISLVGDFVFGQEENLGKILGSLSMR